jgi:hypothetical protein
VTQHIHYIALDPLDRPLQLLLLPLLNEPLLAA